jgi:inner membrane protein
MDPLTHSLTGAALARTGLSRTTPLATTTLVIAANIPDIDIATYYAGTYAPLALRRGWTHGPLALLLLPVIVAAAMLLYDRFWRRRRRPDAMPARAAPLAVLAFAGVLTHPLLDWMNTYGVRLLMPFSGRWFYGDALFIIDPWLWLLLAAPLVLYAGRRGAIRWAVAGAATTALVVLVPQVPPAAKVLWIAGVGALAAGWLLRRRGRHDAGGPGSERGGHPGGHHETGAWAGGSRPGDHRHRVARVATVVAAVYILVMLAAAAAARTLAVQSAVLAGLPAHDIMVAPLPANPFGGEIVAAGADAYHLGRFHWLGNPRVTWRAQPVPRGPRDGAVAAAMQYEEVRHYLVWSRFPFVTVMQNDAGQLIRFRDARYADQERGGLNGPTLFVDVDGTLHLLD